MTDHHRKKAGKNRNGRNRYEKGRAKHDNHPSKKMLKGYRGSNRGYVAKPIATLADVWPQ